MSLTSALPGEIVRWLSAQEQLSDITFLTEFPAIKKAIPLKKVIVAIGLQSLTLTDKFVENAQGVLERQEYCRTAVMQISLNVHVPFSRGGHTCHEVFSNVADALTFASDLEIEESACGSIVSDRDTDALVLTGTIRISSDFCPAVSSGMHFQSFLNKDLLCGSHIRNQNIHVTPEQIDRWNNPFKTSEYIGNGSSSRIINLGFRPSYVSVFASEYAATEYNSSTSGTSAYTAQACSSSASLGIQLTSNGFKVYNGTNGSDNTIPYLNIAGNRYGYMYVK